MKSSEFGCFTLFQYTNCLHLCVTSMTLGRGHQLNQIRLVHFDGLHSEAFGVKNGIFSALFKGFSPGLDLNSFRCGRKANERVLVRQLQEPRSFQDKFLYHQERYIAEYFQRCDQKSTTNDFQANLFRINFRFVSECIKDFKALFQNQHEAH